VKFPSFNLLCNPLSGTLSTSLSACYSVPSSSAHFAFLSQHYEAAVSPSPRYAPSVLSLLPWFYVLLNILPFPPKPLAVHNDHNLLLPPPSPRALEAPVALREIQLVYVPRHITATLVLSTLAATNCLDLFSGLFLDVVTLG